MNCISSVPFVLSICYEHSDVDCSIDVLFTKCRWSCLHCDSVMADKVDQWVLCIRECYYFTSHPASAHLLKLKILVSLTFFFNRWILSHFLLLWILKHRDQKTLMNGTLYCEKRTVLIPCSV